MGLSRNKVAVSEGAAGSPPFYGESGRVERSKYRTSLLFNFEWPTKKENRKHSEIVGPVNAQGPPVPIPNTEVKLCGADNTYTATYREDR